MNRTRLSIRLSVSVALAALAAAGIGALGVAAATKPVVAGNVVDLQLVLAVDVSRSMDYNEQRIQRDGYVQAFRDKEIQKAITSGPYGRIAVTYIEWSGAFFQRVLVPWEILGSDEDIANFADDLARAPIEVDNRTSISAGLSFAATAFNQSGVVSDRLTIDVSGDGPNNEGPYLTPIRDGIVKQGININGLPLLLDPSPTLGPLGRVSLSDYYQDCVIGGPGSFVIPVTDLKAFSPAIHRKLIQEIAWAPTPDPAIVPVVDTLSGGRQKVDCYLAEQFRQGP